MKIYEIGIQRNISDVSIKKAMEMEDPRQSMIALKSLGFSLGDIATQFDCTRQWVGEVVGPTKKEDRAQTPSVDKPGSDYFPAIWQEAATDLTWWGTKGRMDKQRLVIFFVKKGYTWQESRDLSQDVSLPKLDVILIVSFSMKASHEAKKSWFESMIEHHTKAEILQVLNKGQNLKIPEHTFKRIWREYGLVAKVRGRSI